MIHTIEDLIYRLLKQFKKINIIYIVMQIRFLEKSENLICMTILNINGDFKPNLKNSVIFDDITKIIIYIFL